MKSFMSKDLLDFLDRLRDGVRDRFEGQDNQRK
jgi:hypothetical protein